MGSALLSLELGVPELGALELVVLKFGPPALRDRHLATMTPTC